MIIDTNIDQLTIVSRRRAARKFLAEIKISATSIKNYIQRVVDVTPKDRQDLRDKWESPGLAMRRPVSAHYRRSSTSSPSKTAAFRRYPCYEDDEMPIGVTARLAVVCLPSAVGTVLFAHV
jgi:hypothetical protein